MCQSHPHTAYTVDPGCVPTCTVWWICSAPCQPQTFKAPYTQSMSGPFDFSRAFLVAFWVAQHKHNARGCNQLKNSLPACYVDNPHSVTRFKAPGPPITAALGQRDLGSTIRPAGWHVMQHHGTVPGRIAFAYLRCQDTTSFLDAPIDTSRSPHV